MKFTVILLLLAMIQLSNVGARSLQERKGDDVGSSDLAKNSSESPLGGIRRSSETATADKSFNEQTKVKKPDKSQQVFYRYVRSTKRQDIANPKQESLGYGYGGFGGYGRYGPGYWLPGMTGYGAGVIGGYKPMCKQKIPRYPMISYVPNTYVPPFVFEQPYGIPGIAGQYGGFVNYGQPYGTPDTYGKYGGPLINGPYGGSDNYKPGSYGRKSSCKNSPYLCSFGGGGIPPGAGEVGEEMPPGGGEMPPEADGEMPPESGGEVPPETGEGQPQPEGGLNEQGAPAEGGNRPLTYPGMYLSNTYADMYQPQYYSLDDYNQRRRRYARAYEPYQGYVSGMEESTLMNEFKRKTSGHENTLDKFSRQTGYGIIDDRYRYIPYNKAALNYIPNWEKFITYRSAYEPETSYYSPPKHDDFNHETNDAGKRSDEYGYGMRSIVAEESANSQISDENYSVPKEKREGNVHKDASYDRSYYKEAYDINNDDGQYVFVGEEHEPKVDRRSPLELSDKFGSSAWNDANLKPVVYEAPYYRSIASFYSGSNINTNKNGWSGEPFAKYNALGTYNGGHGTNIAGRNYYTNRYLSDASVRGQGVI